MISGWLILCAWFTLLFKALQSESGSVKFVAQVFCLPRLRPGMGRAESSRELANTFVRIWGAVRVCNVSGTCHMPLGKIKTPAYTVRCVCVCSRANCKAARALNKFCFRFLQHEDVTSSSRQRQPREPTTFFQPLPVSDNENDRHFTQIACTSSPVHRAN